MNSRGCSALAHEATVTITRARPAASAVTPMDEQFTEVGCMSNDLIPSKRERRYAHPARPHGSAQIALSDLLLIAIIVGLLMMFFQYLNRDNFFPAGALTALSIVAFVIYLLMSAARHGITSRLSRWMWSCGSFLLGVGTLSGGFCVFFGLGVLFSKERITKEIILTTVSTIIILSVGFALNRWAWRRHRESESRP